MGVPGSVLMSKNVYDKVKNQSSFSFESYGSFEFKNVDEPMEIYALASEDLVVPRKEDLKGKLKENRESSFSKFLIPIIGISALILAFFMWNSNKDKGGLNLAGGNSIEPINTPLSKDIRDKRVAIMVFENKTGSKDLDDFGVMISDWITKGLMETGDANVISAANIQDKVALAGMRSGKTNQFAKETGVGVALQGRYYMQEDQLIIHANVVDTELGEVIHALETIQGKRNDMISILNELTDEVLGFWSVKDLKRFRQNPPKYEAYKKYLSANHVWGERKYLDFIESQLEEAIHIDPDFHEAKLKLTILYNNSDRDLIRRDSLISQLNNPEVQLSPWEQLRLEQIQASMELKHQKAAEVCEKMFGMDVSDATANYNAGNFYLRANMPLKSIEITNKLEDQYRDFNDDLTWIEPRKAEAYYMAGKYQEAIDVANTYAFPKMSIAVANIHLRSLVRLDSLNSLDGILEEYLQNGVYNGVGVEESGIDLIASVCKEAFLLDKVDLLNEFVKKLEAQNIENKETSFDFDYNNAMILFYKNDFVSALSHLEKLESVNKSRFEFFKSSSLKGWLYAQLGNREKALEILDELKKMENEILSEPSPSVVFAAMSNYVQATIYLGLDQADETLKNLETAIKMGLWFNPVFWQYDELMKPLFGNPEFQELVRPKG